MSLSRVISAPCQDQKQNRMRATPLSLHDFPTIAFEILFYAYGVLPVRMVVCRVYVWGL